MKRFSYLYDFIYSLENVKLAYYKACKGKRSKINTIDFSNNYTENIEEIIYELKNKTYSFGNYTYFYINEPKRRRICAASFKERVIHHAIMNVLDPYFETFQINHSYACRKGKGTFKAVKIAQKYNSGSSFFLKMDIKKYFDSVDHNILKTLLHSRFKDPDIVAILSAIIDSFCVTENKGIPIGNLTSQYFANFYLAYLDRYIKQTLSIKKYVRYMDDFVVFSDSRDEILKYIELIEDFTDQKLKLVLKIKYINRAENGLPFLGFLIKPKYIGVLKNNRRSSVKKYKELNRLLKTSSISQLEYGVRVQSIISGKLKVIGVKKVKEIYPLQIY